MKTIKKQIALVLTIASVLACMVFPASAASTTAFDILTSSNYAKVFTLSGTGRTIPYTSSSLSTRGTTSYGASNSSYIDNASDELYILDVGCTNGTYWAYVSYPTSSKRVQAYIPLSAISINNAGHTKTTSTGKFYCSLRENTAISSSYYVAKGDTVYLIATSSSKYQILYPISGGKWRLAWCSASDYAKYCGSGGSSQPVANGSNLCSPVPDGAKFSKKSSDGAWYGYHDINRNVSTNTPVYAMVNGTAYFYQCHTNGKLRSYGNYVKLVSSDGVYEVRYAHLSRFNSIHMPITTDTPYPCSGAASKQLVGTVNVSAGTTLGWIGTTGNSSGNHLHIEVYKNGVRIDPTTMFSNLK